MNNNLFKNLTLLIGGILFATMGFMYVLLTDLYLGNTSTYLLIGIVFACCGCIFFLLAENFKEKPTMFFVFKGVGIFMSIMFILFLFAFTKNDIFSNKTYLKLFKTYKANQDDPGKTITFLAKAKFRDSLSIAFNLKAIYYVNLGLTIVAVISQALNLVPYIIYGVEE